MTRRTRAVAAIAMLAVARAYGQSHAVFIASVVREQILPGNGEHESLLAFLKPIRFFKGGAQKRLVTLTSA